MISDMIATHLDLEHFPSEFDWMSSEIFLNLNIYGTSMLSIQLIFSNLVSCIENSMLFPSMIILTFVLPITFFYSKSEKNLTPNMFKVILLQPYILSGN